MDLTHFLLSSSQCLNAPNIFIEYTQEWNAYGRNYQCSRLDTLNRELGLNTWRTIIIKRILSIKMLEKLK